MIIYFKLTSRYWLNIWNSKQNKKGLFKEIIRIIIDYETKLEMELCYKLYEK
jgi:hypothetical protein